MLTVNLVSENDCVQYTAARASDERCLAGRNSGERDGERRTSRESSSRAKPPEESPGKTVYVAVDVRQILWDIARRRL